MARLQDYPDITPSASDKFLVVQSTGQGLVAHTSKLDSANPTGTGSLSLNRKENTTVGYNSTTEGSNCTASGSRSHAEGASTTASGDNGSHSEGNETTASGISSHAEGVQTIANHSSQHVFGAYNVADPSTAAASSRGNYIEIVGKGTANNARSNARTLDWSGNEVLAGGLKVNGTQDVGIAPFGYNANTDRNTVSNRQTAIRYLRTNVFSKGGSTSSVRYNGGYYFGYIFCGGTNYGFETYVEFAQALTSGEKIIFWGYNIQNDAFEKIFSIS